MLDHVQGGFHPKCKEKFHAKPESYRPIKLTCFLLKTFEGVIDIHLKCLYPDTYSLPRYMSTLKEDLWNQLISWIYSEIPWVQRMLTCRLSWYWGAFNNVKSDSIIHSTKELGVDDWIWILVLNLLRQWIIYFTIGVASIQILVFGGTPQGVLLSPLPGNFILSNLLS